MRFYSAVVWRHQLSQFGGPFKAAADQTTGSRIFCPCSTPGPGECKADLPGKHVHTGILLDRCASLFVQGTRGPGHGPHMAFMLPCMIGMERWVNILLVASFHEHCAVHVLQLESCAHGLNTGLLYKAVFRWFPAGKASLITSVSTQQQSQCRKYYTIM